MDSDDQLEIDYERCFRSLLWRVSLWPVQRRVEQLLGQCRSQSASRVSAGTAYDQVYRQTRSQTIEQLVTRRIELAPRGQLLPQASQRQAARIRMLLEAAIPLFPTREAPDFHCDAGVGGAARWLRAAGYDARFWPGIDDDELIAKVHGSSSILLTTDGRLMQRAVIVWGIVPALLVPLSAGGKRGQFRFTMNALQLPRRAPRCMACGGRLRSVDKETVRDRIPPRTYPLCNEYLECDDCGKLFWRGTHWREIEKLLEGCAPHDPQADDPKSFALGPSA